MICIIIRAAQSLCSKPYSSEIGKEQLIAVGIVDLDHLITPSRFLARNRVPSDTIQAPTNTAIRMSVALTNTTHRLQVSDQVGRSFHLLTPDSDLVSVGILNSEKVAICFVLFPDRHQPSASEIGGV